MAKALIINRLLEELGIKISVLERELGLSNGTLQKAIDRQSDISTRVFEKIVEKYPDVNKDWLLTGNGEPFSGSLNIKKGGKKEVIALGKHVPMRLKPEEYAEAFGNWAGVPMYNVPITASFIETYRDEETWQPQYYFPDPRFKGCDFGVIVTGDSMYSEIRHGDFVVCQEITDTRFIVYGDIYYVVASNGLETCKYVHVDKDDKNNLMLVARNDSVPSSPLPRDMLQRLYKVKGIVRGY